MQIYYFTLFPLKVSYDACDQTMEKDLTNSPFEVFGSLLQKKYNCTKHNARDNNYSSWMLNLNYNCYITN